MYVPTHTMDTPSTHHGRDRHASAMVAAATRRNAGHGVAGTGCPWKTWSSGCSGYDSPIDPPTVTINIATTNNHVRTSSSVRTPCPYGVTHKVTPRVLHRQYAVESASSRAEAEVPPAVRRPDPVSARILRG
ncbi:hypothetical protein GCM10029964_080110 [Kibdelosporangium lantanae]